jgi:hypothetical protein
MNNRLRFNTAKELFETFPTAAEDMTTPATEQPSLEFLRGLLSTPTPEEAVTFCSYLLPRRVAVWWGHQCLRNLPEGLTEQDAGLLATAEEWVREPEDDRRYAALDAGMNASVKTPGAWIALAAGWSGGSMAPSGMAPVVPPPYLTARAVNAGVLSAIARVPLKQRPMVLDACISMAIQMTEK